MKSKAVIRCLWAVFIIFSHSCTKEYELDHAQFDDLTPNLAMPLFHSSMSLKDIINDYDNTHLFQEDGQNFLKLVYENIIFSKTAEELIILDNQVIPQENSPFVIPATIPPIGYSETYQTSFIFQATNNEKFDSIFFKDGRIQVNFMSNLNYPNKLVVQIPSLTKDGFPFSKIIYDQSETLPINVTREFDLTGYKAVFDHSNGNNRLNINYTVTAFDAAGQQNNSPYSVTFSGILYNLKFRKAFGNLGNLTFELKKDTIQLDIFNNNIYTFKFHIIDPRLKLTIENYLGIPINININEAKAHSARNAPYDIQITGSFPNPFPVDQPLISEMGLPKTTVYTLNKDNSNLPDVVNISPQYYILDLVGQSNNTPATKNFVYDSARFNIKTLAELPLWGEAWDFVVQDTFDFEFKDDVEKIEWITFFFKTTNGFPIDAVTQGYFVDENYNVIDSILMRPTERLIEAAPVGPEPDLRVTHSVNKIVTSTLTGNRIANLKRAKKILVRGTLATSQNGNQTVKIYSDYRLEVAIATRIQFRIKSDEI